MAWKNQGGGPWGSGGPRGPWGSGSPSGGPTPNLEDLIRRGQDRLQSFLPGGNFGATGVVFVIAVAIVIWALWGFFTVRPDELGVVLRFGKHVRTVQPGLSYHLPYPIETVLLPKALRVNTLSIGMRLSEAGRSGSIRDVPEESLMLTGDENIVDVDFTVLWRIKPDGVGDYLFNIQNPEGTVKAVAESAMREVIGRGEIAPILTGSRAATEQAVHDLMQKTLNDYGAGVLIQQVQMQKVDLPAQVIELVPRRAGGAGRSTAAAERRPDLRQPRRARGARQRRQDPAGRRRLQTADSGRGERSDVALSAGLRAIQEGARCDAGAPLS